MSAQLISGVHGQDNVSENVQDNEQDQDNISEMDLLHPRASEELLEQMRRDRQEELKARKEFEIEKAKARKNLEADPLAQEKLVEAKQSAEQEIQEMMVGEISGQIPHRLVERGWKPDDKINVQRDHFCILREAMLNATSDEEQYQYCLQIVQTAQRKDKKGYTVNAKSILGNTPLEAMLLTTRNSDSNLLWHLDLARSLVEAGTIINTFSGKHSDLSDNPDDLIKRGYPITAIDLIMRLYNMPQWSYSGLEDWNP